TLAFPSWYVGGVAVCPQGKMLALCGAANVRLIDLASGDVKCDLPPTYLTRPAVMQFAPSGKRILAVAPTLPSLRIWDVATGTAVRDLEDSTGFLQQAAFSPNGWCVAATTPHGDVAVWEVVSGKKLLGNRELGKPGQAVRFVSFADTRTLVFARAT